MGDEGFEVVFSCRVAVAKNECCGVGELDVGRRKAKVHPLESKMGKVICRRPSVQAHEQVKQLTVRIFDPVNIQRDIEVLVATQVDLADVRAESEEPTEGLPPRRCVLRFIHVLSRKNISYQVIGMSRPPSQGRTSPSSPPDTLTAWMTLTTLPVIPPLPDSISSAIFCSS